MQDFISGFELPKVTKKTKRKLHTINLGRQPIDQLNFFPPQTFTGTNSEIEILEYFQNSLFTLDSDGNIITDNQANNHSRSINTDMITSSDEANPSLVDAEILVVDNDDNLDYFFIRSYVAYQALHQTQFQLPGLSQVTEETSVKEKKEPRANSIKLSISNLERVFSWLSSFPELIEIAQSKGVEVKSFEFLSTYLAHLEFITLPSYIPRKINLDFLPLDNKELREARFNELYSDWLILYRLGTKITYTDAYPYFKKKYAALPRKQVLDMFLLVKKIDNLALGWGGEQHHLFEQLLRNFLYYAYNKITPELYDFYDLYRCNPDYTYTYLYECIIEALGYESTDLYYFYLAFLNLMNKCEGDKYKFLTKEEISQIWSSEVITDRLDKVKDRWGRIFSELEDAESQLIPTRVRLERFNLMHWIPKEVSSVSKKENTNELVIKVFVKFGSGRSIFLDLRIDYLFGYEINDWKTSTKPLTDVDKFQIILQQIVVFEFKKRYPKDLPQPINNERFKFYYLTEINLESVLLSTDQLPAFYIRAEDYEDPDSLFNELFDKPIEDDPRSEETKQLHRKFGMLRCQFSRGEILRLLREADSILEFTISNKAVVYRMLRSLNTKEMATPQLPDILKDEENREEVERFINGVNSDAQMLQGELSIES